MELGKVRQAMDAILARGDPDFQLRGTLAGLIGARPEALRTRSFWLLASTFTLSGVVITGFQAQWIPHFRDIGYSAAVAAGALQPAMAAS